MKFIGVVMARVQKRNAIEKKDPETASREQEETKGDIAFADVRYVRKCEIPQPDEKLTNIFVNLF